MSENKVYILKRDLPEQKAGTRYTLSPNGTHYYAPMDASGVVYTKKVVESSPDWWESEEEMEVSKAKALLESEGYVLIPAEEISTLYKHHYTEDDLRTVFQAGRRLVHTLGGMNFEIYSFDNYLKSINK